MSGWNYSCRASYVIEIRVQEGVQPYVLVFYHTYIPVGRNMINVKCSHISGSVFHAIWLVGSSLNRTFLFLSFFIAFRISLSKAAWKSVQRDSLHSFSPENNGLSRQFFLIILIYYLSKQTSLKTFTSWRPLTLNKLGKVSIW